MSKGKRLNLGWVKEYLDLLGRRGLPRRKKFLKKVLDIVEATEGRGTAITMAGRNVHLDKYLIRRFNLKKFRGKELRYLDIGASPLEIGAPTTEDTYRLLRKSGIKPRIVAVDIRPPPKNFNPSIKDIEYKTADATKDRIEGQFEVIRAMNVWRWGGEQLLDKIMENVKQNIVEGGILVLDGAGRQIDIYQKQGGELIHVEKITSKHT